MSQPCSIPLHCCPGHRPARPCTSCLAGLGPAAVPGVRAKLLSPCPRDRGDTRGQPVLIPRAGRAREVLLGLVPTSGGIRQVLLVVSGCSQDEDGAVGETGLGNGPGGECCSGISSNPILNAHGGAGSGSVWGRDCGWGSPRAPDSQCDPQAVRLPRHSLVAGGTLGCETLMGAPTPSSSSGPLSSPFSPA